MAEFDFTELFPLTKDTTNYRLISKEGVSLVDTPLGKFLKVDASAITHLTFFGLDTLSSCAKSLMIQKQVITIDLSLLIS